jgi:hypothetical protein
VHKLCAYIYCALIVHPDNYLVTTPVCWWVSSDWMKLIIHHQKRKPHREILVAKEKSTRNKAFTCVAIMHKPREKSIHI